MNSNANADREKNAIRAMMDYADKQGLGKEDILFSSTVDENYRLGVPKSVVRNMFSFSNVFIFPTIAECCSMVMLEAMSGENLMVLNGDIESMKEIAGYEGGLFMKFGSIWNNTQYANEEAYYKDWANIIIHQLDSDMPKLAKKRADTVFNEDWVYENQVKGLL
jgi:hypothetical protein